MLVTQHWLSQTKLVPGHGSELSETNPLSFLICRDFYEYDKMVFLKTQITLLRMAKTARRGKKKMIINEGKFLMSVPPLDSSSETGDSEQEVELEEPGG